jgi:hypothetical protein
MDAHASVEKVIDLAAEFAYGDQWHCDSARIRALNLVGGPIWTVEAASSRLTIGGRPE